jgi:CheY-like chemotaxis protein
MLTVILGHADLVLADLPADSPLHPAVVEIREAARRSAELTGQLLAFARRQTVEPRILDLNQEIESILRMLGRLIGETVDLRWRPAATLEPIRMDPAQVHQLLANLVVNARDAIGNRPGRITIETGQAEFDREYCTAHPDFAPGRFVMLAVSDDGCGMDAETRAQIFEPFFTTKEVGEGTGLGLSSVYGVVRQNDGFINVYSELGRGTTFRIYLPVCTEPDDGVAGPRSEPAPTTGTETILLVEDEPAILGLGTRILEEAGYRVLAAATPEAAIAAARERCVEIDLLVTDVVMPGMDGRTLASHLESVCPQLKLLYTSGYPASVIASQSSLDEGLAFLQKPFAVTDLLRKVRQVLDG